MSMRMLVSDVGGTNVRLALAEERDGKIALVNRDTLATRDYTGLEHAILAYRKRYGSSIDCAAIAVAAPIVKQEARFSNLSWIVTAESLARALGIGKVHLLNDLEAQAAGLTDLSPDEVSRLQAGEAEPRGNLALLSPGTGLGRATVYRGHGTPAVVKSEGGHSAFGAHDDETLDLLKFLSRKYGGHVSRERVLSGPGLYEVYLFLRERSREPEPAWLTEESRATAPSLAVSRAGLAGSDAVARAAVELFVDILAREASDAALDAFSTGGIYLGGGILPHLLPLLKERCFLRTFTDKGRMSPLLERMPVSVVLSDDLGILGAARYCLNEEKVRCSTENK